MIIRATRIVYGFRIKGSTLLFEYRSGGNWKIKSPDYVLLSLFTLVRIQESRISVNDIFDVQARDPGFTFSNDGTFQPVPILVIYNRC